MLSSLVSSSSSSWFTNNPRSRTTRTPKAVFAALHQTHCWRTPDSPYVANEGIGAGKTFPDPTRPDLYYHLVGPPTPVSDSHPAFALSFLSSPPPTKSGSERESAGVIGWLPAVVEHVAGAEGGEEAGLNDFKENHERNIPPLGRIGDPDDIIATVLVDDGKILADTYQPMPAYRLCTGDGLTKLTPGLTNLLHITLKQLI
ncbi:hypothetical protein AMATHDRAFT_1090 [Amanita thiersii Skay4041]|uniref:Uncharacterized protein n=1 Tax=Amanita thiersii Skay4041 TaxID=703135 RepID=A0A2A9NVM3_9AGAR|nr:hypothetical protein AMATHDRAFT_1090 [Amanita thiersii Skay4041]